MRKSTVLDPGMSLLTPIQTRRRAFRSVSRAVGPRSQVLASRPNPLVSEGMRPGAGIGPRGIWLSCSWVLVPGRSSVLTLEASAHATEHCCAQVEQCAQVSAHEESTLSNRMSTLRALEHPSRRLSTESSCVSGAGSGARDPVPVPAVSCRRASDLFGAAVGRHSERVEENAPAGRHLTQIRGASPAGDRTRGRSGRSCVLKAIGGA
jgi:hypothetical protein